MTGTLHRSQARPSGDRFALALRAIKSILRPSPMYRLNTSSGLIG